MSGETATLPASAAYTALARRAAATMAARADLPIDQVEDMRLAVDEAASQLIGADPESDVTCSLRGGRTMTEGKGRGSTWRTRERDLLRRLAALAHDDPDYERVREELVTMHLRLVRHCADRFKERGESFGDLVQIGTVGLIKAIDGYDLGRGVEFSTYATPLILGEIRHHFRREAWAVHVPRATQERHRDVLRTTDDLTVALQRTPTTREVAEHLGLGIQEVLDALEARQGFSTQPLEADHRGSVPRARSTSVDEPGFDSIEDHEALLQLLAELPELERRTIELLFDRCLTQRQAAEELGISQTQVSRVLSRTLPRLREGMLAN